VRGKIEVPAAADNAEIEALAKANANVQRFLQGTTIKKVIVIPQKLVNIVAQ
jgi:leucyl-tRNA synthetase